MRQRQSGFTMIELIMVIVILGILAAIAMPRFIDLSSDAKTSAFQGVRGAAASAMAVNYAACAAVAHASAANPTKCKMVNTCDDLGGVLHGGRIPSGYTVAASGSESAVNGTEFVCTIAGAGSDADPWNNSFTAISAGN